MGLNQIAHASALQGGQARLAQHAHALAPEAILEARRILPRSMDNPSVCADAKQDTTLSDLPSVVHLYLLGALPP